MHEDARNLPDNSIIEGDLCIVGAGAAGISMSLDWIGLPYKVILLESGGFHYEDQIQDLYKGKNTGQKYYPMRSNRLSFFGGTTNHWAGMCSTFDDIDFVKRDWVPYSGWPFDKKELDPFYSRANEVLKLGPYEYDLSYWQTVKENLRPFPLDPDVIWHKIWQNSPIYGGNGGMAKEHGQAILKSKNIHLYTYACMVDMKTNESGSKVSEVLVKNHAGKNHRVRAKHFILAGGAIQNARMLLAANSQQPAGLGNVNDLVGRYFMEHLEVDAGELWLLKPFSTALYDWSNIWCELAIRKEIQEREQILNGTAGLTPLTVGLHLKPRMQTYQDDDPQEAWSKVLKNWHDADSLALIEKSGSVNNAFQMQTRVEQVPNPDSRVFLDTEKDALGVPLANLHWSLTDLDKRSIRRINELIGETAGKAGFGRVLLMPSYTDKDDMSWPETTNGGWHHMGTTRMHEDPKQGVVDVNCRVHGIDNLFVAGAACYPTAGAVNPTLTLVALSLRLSDHLKGQIKVV